MSTNKLIEHISKFIQLDEEEVNAISTQIHVRKYKTGDILLRDGDISTVSYFNLEGCVRLYHLVDGEEKTAFFYTENGFISSIRSFTTGTPSNHYLVPGMLCDVACLKFHALIFPKLTLEQSVVLGAWILWAYVIVLLIGVLKSR
ncbi:DUF5367 family protein [Flammeovirga sp. EKP202]|uniref:DUF5367 family protein n=1 Tax=Flammeovirga sp. EKP202 TaxID=2770592 RepID=UPI00165F0D3C|nr:DUF5367 family protein [Flammeovirga sp. EKP202]MBD0404923.1 DUF5367 family protein [Flammeovirga sp. EKP202]